MKSTVETLSPTRVKLAIEVPFDELKPSLQKAYREIGAQVQVPGFRRGKIPAAVIDQRVGRGAVLNEAVQEAIPEQIDVDISELEINYSKHLSDIKFPEGVKPISRVDLTLVTIVPP